MPLVAHSDIRELQHKLNNFTRTYPKLGHHDLRIDGKKGHLTNKRIRDIKHDLGYSHDQIDDSVGDWFYRRMTHPNEINPKVGATHEAVQRGKRARAQRRRQVRNNRIHAFLKPGVGTFDGIPVAKCAIPILEWCRKHGWDGRLVSGWRSRLYSRSLCIRMCGAASCPGRCAGTASNHVGNSPAFFGLDVSSYEKFARVVATCPIQPHVHNALGSRDPVHFSPSGR